MVSPSTIVTKPPMTSRLGAEGRVAHGSSELVQLFDPETALIETKLRRPEVGRDLLRRPGLIERLSQPGCQVGLVVGPAGYGKSTLLTQWSAEVDKPVAWVRLDCDDSIPLQFWSYVIEALRTAAPQQISVTPAALTSQSNADPVPLVVNALAALESGVILVLDDYHEVRSHDVDAGLDRLLRYLPATSMVVISSRHDPNVSLASLRASTHLVEIRQEHLRFAPQEAEQWLTGHNIKASPEALSACVDVFEGWPAALALALGIASSAPDRAAALAAVRGHNRNVADYIRDVVVSGHADDRNPLLVAALCPRVCGSLVDHALDNTSGSHERLQRLARSHVLLEMVDRSYGWFRLHQLVADYLLAEVGDDPMIHVLAVRSAEWHAANGHAREALALYLRAGEHGRAADIINRSWLEQIQRGHHDTLRRDLERIDPHVAAGNASYLVSRAWLLAHEGRAREANALIVRAAAIGGGGPLPDGAPSVEAAYAVMDCLFILNEFSGAVRSAEQADEMVTQDATWRPLADLGVGYVNYMTGNLARAQQAFDRALASSFTPLRANAIGWSAVIDVAVGDLDAARARLNDAASEWADHPLLPEPAAVAVAKAAVACAEGRPLDAVAELEGCIQRLATTNPPDRLEVLSWLADAESRVGRVDRARRRIAEARSITDRIGASARHTERLAEIEDRLGAAATINGRDPGLTDRERRILQLLSATHLSQREIGRELGISFNTIKSHVKAVYLKLGACSREEASQIARMRGFV